MSGTCAHWHAHVPLIHADWWKVIMLSLHVAYCKVCNLPLMSCLCCTHKPHSTEVSTEIYIKGCPGLAPFSSPQYWGPAGVHVENGAEKMKPDKSSPTRHWLFLSSFFFFSSPLSIFIFAGSGVALMSNFEQLLRGVWRPDTNEILNMSLWVCVSCARACRCFQPNLRGGSRI